MKAPTSVRIGPFDYEVRWMDRLEENDMKAFGICNSTEQVIRICSIYKRQRVAVSFLHEILHTLGLVYGVPEDDEKKVKEEDAVAGHALGLTAFWRDNPDVAQWWQDLVWNDPTGPFTRGIAE